MQLIDECYPTPAEYWGYDSVVSWFYTIDAEFLAAYVASYGGGTCVLGGDAKVAEIEAEAAKLDINCHERSSGGYGNYGRGYGGYRNNRGYGG